MKQNMIEFRCKKCNKVLGEYKYELLNGTFIYDKICSRCKRRNRLIVKMKPCTKVEIID